MTDSPFFLYLRPEQASYSASLANGGLATPTSGGRPRTRQDFIGSASSVRVQWALDFDEYTFLQQFVEFTLNDGTTPFNVELIIDGAALQMYSCVIEPGSMSLVRQSGLTYVVQAQLWAQRTPEDVDVKAARALVQSALRGGPYDPWANALSNVVNTQLSTISITPLT